MIMNTEKLIKPSTTEKKMFKIHLLLVGSENLSIIWQVPPEEVLWVTVEDGGNSDCDRDGEGDGDGAYAVSP